MTYEKFEHKAIGMLLAGDDPRLKKLTEQINVGEVLSRVETNMGFEVEISAPATLAIEDSEGRISGVEVQLSEFPIVTLELSIKNGLIDRFKAVYATEMTYPELIEHYDELVFAYTNKKNSILKFQMDHRDPNEVTLVKNIASISEQIDANILKVNVEEQEMVPDSIEKIIEETFIEPAIDNSNILSNVENSKIPVPNHAHRDLSSMPQTIIPEVEELEEIIARLDKESLSEDEEPQVELIEEPTLRKPEESEFEEVVAEIVGEETPFQTTFDVKPQEQVTPTSVHQHEPIIEAVLKSYQEKPIQVQESPPPPVYEDIMLPPSFSIPKIPDAIRERWTVENTPMSHTTTNQDADLKQEVLTQILSQQHLNSDRIVLKETTAPREYVDPRPRVTTSTESSEKYYESNVGLTDLLDGKSPQSGVSSTEKTDQPEERRFEARETFGSYHSFENTPNKTNENFEFKNLTPKELSNPNLRIENTGVISPQALESIALSETDEEQMNLEIARMEMEQRGREVKVATLLIVLGIFCFIAFIIIAFL